VEGRKKARAAEERSRLYTLALLSAWNLSLLAFLLVLFQELNFNWLFILHFYQLLIICTGAKEKAPAAKRLDGGCNEWSDSGTGCGHRTSFSEPPASGARVVQKEA
jgi:hypothetical protein